MGIFGKCVPPPNIFDSLRPCTPPSAKNPAIETFPSPRGDRGGASQKYWGAHIFQKCPLYLVLSGFKTQLYLVLSGSQNLLIMAKKPWL